MIKQSIVPLILLVLVLMGCKKEGSEVRIIPEPANMSIEKGAYRISSSAPIYLHSHDEQAELAVDYLLERLERSAGLELEMKIVHEKTGKGIYLEVGKLNFSDHPDAYTLEVNANGVNCIGNSPRALFYGVQSILQLLPPQIYGSELALEADELLIPYVTIEDVPRYDWRGMHLDVGRHAWPLSHG